MPVPELPDFERPPVDEIVAAVQFRPLDRFRIPEIVKLDAALTEWTLVDTADAFPPIVETPPGEPGFPGLTMMFGGVPQRAIFDRQDGRWTLQIQHDRVAVHERRTTERPSCRNVLPMLEACISEIAAALGFSIEAEEHRSELIELIYINRIDEARGFAGPDKLGGILAGVSDAPGPAPYDCPSGVQLAWAFELSEAEGFVGRMRIEASVGQPSNELSLQINSRRYVGREGAFAELANAHQDIVEGFTAVTTERAHKFWGRLS